MKLMETVLIKGTIVVKTGLHIGAGKDNIEIGGLDLPVIKNPRTAQPYIPGSSLKGKVRFLVEWSTPGALTSGDVHSCKEPLCQICRIFGAGRTGDTIGGRGPTRMLVRDASLLLEQGEVYDPEKFLEVKYENTIDRMKGTALNPRPIERVVPGTKFAFEIAFRIFDTGDGGKCDHECLGAMVKGLQLLEKDTLGGSGSRGCGKVVFENMAITSKNIQKHNIASLAELADAIKGVN